MGIVRSALRHLGSAPGFTIVAILSLALGIGPTTAIFTLVDEVLLRSLPVANPDALLLLRVEHGKRGRMSRAGEGPGGVDPVTGRETGTPLSRAIFERLRSTAAPVSAVFAFAPFSQVTVLVDGVPETTVAAQYVSGGYYGGLGVQPAIGRLIEPADDAFDAGPVAVISHRFWVRHFGAGQTPLAPRCSSTGSRQPSSACRRPASTAPSRSARRPTCPCRCRTTCCSSPIARGGPRPTTGGCG